MHFQHLRPVAALPTQQQQQLQSLHLGKSRLIELIKLSNKSRSRRKKPQKYGSARDWQNEFIPSLARVPTAGAKDASQARAARVKEECVRGSLCTSLSFARTTMQQQR